MHPSYHAKLKNFFDKQHRPLPKDLEHSFIIFVSRVSVSRSSYLLSVELFPTFGRFRMTYHFVLITIFSDARRTCKMGQVRRDGLLVQLHRCGSLRYRSFIYTVCFVAWISLAALPLSRIVRALRYRTNMSEASKNLHAQLFRALLVQVSILLLSFFFKFYFEMSIPCVFLYLPCSTVFMTPFLLPDIVFMPPWLITWIYSWFPIS